MLQSYLQYFKRLKSIYAINCHINPDQSLRFSFVHIHKKGQKLTTSNKAEHILGFDDLEKQLDIQIPVALSITGKGVLSRKVTSIDTQWPENLLEVLPNAKPEQFVGQVFQLYNEAHLSFARKDLVLDIIEQFRALDIHIVHLNVSLLNIQDILPLIDQKDKTLHIGDSVLNLKDQKLQAVAKRSEVVTTTVSIGGEELPSSFLTAFASGFQVLVRIPIVIFNLTKLENWKEDYWFKRWIKIGGWRILIGMFVLLLGNFILFSYFTNKNQKLGLELSFYEKQLAELQVLEIQLQNSESLTGTNNILEHSKTSFYADQIAAIVPPGIQLKELHIFPALNSSKREKEYFSFDKKVIHILGQNNKVMMLNLWIKQLEGLDWVEEVKVLPYKEQNGIGQFDLELLLRTI